MGKGVVGILSAVICLLLISGFAVPGVSSAGVCEKEIAEVIAIKGIVEARRSGETEWTRVEPEMILCDGDMVRVKKHSTATVRFYNEINFSLQAGTVTLSAPEAEKPVLFDLLKGAAYIFSRIPRSLRIRTPFFNGDVEGTEFFVKVEEDRGLISVFEGRVAVRNDAGSIVLPGGHSAIAKKGIAPEAVVVAKPRDAVHWALYYPEITDYRPEDIESISDAGVREKALKSVKEYRAGNLYEAIVAIEDVPDTIKDPKFFTYRSSLLLQAGSIEAALADMDKALALDPDAADALALKSIVKVVQNDRAMALELAAKGVAADAGSSAVWIALSYAKQANFDLTGALESVQQAVEADPDNALAYARLSELWMSMGDLDKGEEAAEKAIALNPHVARTQTVLGFAYLTKIKIDQAKEAFDNAIILDRGAPLPRLGLGLAKIRKGDLEEGRKEMELAASLDPNNALIRSYLGKAYFEEKRDTYSETQLATAKELDPLDPTPWFYDAIRKQSINRPVEALQDIQKSIELNDNRAVYRSRLLLDEDLAARSASLARIYNDLGFQQLALVEGWKSVNTDPSNYSAHRFLADSYSALPRHEIARVSELLQSQLLQPINIAPVQPHLAESNTYIYENAGISHSSYNEYNQLFTRDRLALQASGFVGDNDTLGDEIVQSGVWGRFSYSLGQFHYETDGFRDNNDQDQDIYNAFVQASLTPNTSVQGEVRYKERENGDLSIRFFPYDIAYSRRDEEELKSARFGFNHIFNPKSQLIGSFIKGSEEYDVVDRPGIIIPFPPFGFAEIQEVGIFADKDGYIGEIQHIYRTPRCHVVSGAGYFEADEDTTFSTIFEVIAPPITIPSVFPQSDKIYHTNLYVYAHFNYPRTVTWTLGASGDFFSDDTTVDQDQFNPKFGLVWDLSPFTTLRAGVFRVLKRSLFLNQTIEPTQIAGFNQFFDDIRATDATRWGIGIDHKFTPSIFGGTEFSRRYLEPYTQSYTTGALEEHNWREGLGRAYLYWTPNPCVSILGEYQYEWFDYDLSGGAENAVEIKTHRIPLGVNFFHPSGLSTMLKTTYVYQKGDFGNYLMGIVSDDDRFWVVDAALRYRLPKRYGMITLEVKNLLDESFNFQDTDSTNPKIYPERFVFGKFTIAF